MTIAASNTDYLPDSLMQLALSGFIAKPLLPAVSNPTTNP